MVTLASTVIDRVVKGFRERGQVDTLAAAMDDSQQTLTYQGFLPNWGAGTRIEVEGETMIVTSVDTDAKTATVVRGWLESTAASHALGKPIYLNPRIYRSDVIDLFNDCLEDLFGHDLFAVGSTEVTYDPGLIGYTLPADVVDVLRVDALKDDSAKYWEPVGDWLYVDNTDPTDFANNKAIMMRTSLPPGAFRVIYSKSFTRLTAESEDLEAVAGLRPYMTDLPFYYAMSRLMIDSERHRSQIERAESHQRAQDAPAFLALRTGEWYKARYEERIITSRAHLFKEVKQTRPTGYGS